MAGDRQVVSFDEALGSGVAEVRYFLTACAQLSGLRRREAEVGPDGTAAVVPEATVGRVVEATAPEPPTDPLDPALGAVVLGTCVVGAPVVDAAVVGVAVPTSSVFEVMS